MTKPVPANEVVFTVGSGEDNPPLYKDVQLTEVESQKEAAREQNAQARGAWGGQIEFLMTMIGTAVGIGNVWRFPYLCYKNGGGAFLIPYVISLGLVGIPIFYFELAFGQFSSLGAVRIWNISPICKGIGFGFVAATFLIAMSYNVVVTWSVFYLANSFTTNFPWSGCNNTWNDQRCTTTAEYAWMNECNATVKCDRINATLAAKNVTSLQLLETPSEQFFYSGAMKMSNPKLFGTEYADGGIDDFRMPDTYLLICLASVWIIVFLVLLKGINSLGKIVYVVATFPYLIITVMLVFSCTLKGAGKGIEYYLIPDWNKLTEIQVWSDAATQIFFSLSICSGGMIAMSSYNNFRNNVYRDAIIIPLINCATSVYAGFAVFAVLGYLAEMKNVDISEVATAGPGLVFVVYPEALENMPIPTLWTILFFLMLIMLGFSSLFSMTETIFTSIMDLIPELRNKVWKPIMFRGVSILIFFAIVVPDTCPGGFYLMTLVDQAIGGYPLLLLGLAELIAVHWIYGTSRFCDDIELMIGRRPNIYYRATWTVIAPVILLFITVASIYQHEELKVDKYIYPAWCEVIYWLIVMFTVVWIPIVAVVYIYKNGGLEVLRAAAAPSKNWGPALAENRTGIYGHKSSQMLQDISQPQKHTKVRIAPSNIGNFQDNNGFHIQDEGYSSKEENLPITHL